MPFLAPAIAAISAFLAPVITFATSTFVGRLLVSVAASALMQALATKPKTGAAQAAGISTTVTQTGGLNPGSFILGKYATAGTHICPPMSHNPPGVSPLCYLTYVIELGDIPGQTLDRVIINDEYVTLGTVPEALYDFGLPVLGTGFAWVKYYNGTQTTADPYLLSKYGSYPTRPWTADMIGRGLNYAILTFQINPELWQGFRRVRFEMGGIPLYDIRKDATAGGVGTHRWATPATWEQTSNPMVMIYNIMRGISFQDGSVWGGRVAAADLTPAAFMAAMNECDVASPATGGGTEAQFRAGYEVTLDQEPADVIAELLKACSGQIVEVGGRWKVRAGGPGLPIYYFSDADVVISQPQDLKPFPGLEASFNGIHASYPEPASLWESKDAPPRYNATYEAEDQSRRRVADLPLPSVPFGAQVQRLMVAYIKEERRFRRHGLTLPPDAAILEPLDAVSWTSTTNGYVSKVFEVSEVTDDLRNCLQRVALRERDPTDYSYPADILLPSAPGAPGTILPAAQTVPGWAVAGFSLTDAAAVARRPALRLSWTGTGQEEVRAIRWEVRVSATGTLVLQGSTHDVAAGQVIVDGLLPAVSYQARGRFVVDRATLWTSWLTATTPDLRVATADLEATLAAGIAAATDTTAPPVPVGLNVTSMARGDGTSLVTATVTASVAADFAEHEFQIKETTGGTYTGFKTAENRQEWVKVSGVSYSVQVAAFDRTANDSAFCTAVVHVAAADAVPPATPTAFNVATGYGVAWLTCDPAPEADFAKFEIFRQATTTPAPTLATAATSESKSTLMSDLLGVGETAYFWIRAVDVSGNKSAWSVRKTATAPITAVVTAAALAGLIDQTAMAAGQAIIQRVTTLPSGPHGPLAGQFVQLVSDGKLYRNDGTGWIKTVDGADVIANTITSAALIAGTVTTRELAAGAATIEKLSLRDFVNRIDDPGGEADGAGWFLGGAADDWYISIANPKTGLNSLRRDYSGVALNGFMSNRFVFNCAAGQVYYGKVWGRIGATYAGGPGGLRVVWYDAAGAVLSTSNIVATLTTTYQMVTGAVTAPAGAATGRVQATVLNQTAGSVFLDDLFLAEMNAGELVVDGSILANHLSVTTAIITNSLQVANAIITSAMISGTLAASKLDIQARNVTFTGLRCEHNAPAANRFAWSAGSARYINDAGTVTSAAIAAGSSAVWTSGVIYLYWVQGATKLSTTTVAATAFASGNFVLGTYAGGALLNIDFGSTVVDGPNIKTGSVTAAAAIFANLAVQTIDLAVGAITNRYVITDGTDLIDGNANYNTTYPTAAAAYAALGVGGAGFQFISTPSFTVSPVAAFLPEKIRIKMSAFRQLGVNFGTGTLVQHVVQLFIRIRRGATVISTATIATFDAFVESAAFVFMPNLQLEFQQGLDPGDYLSGSVMNFDFYLYKYRASGTTAVTCSVYSCSLDVIEFLR